LDLSARNLCWTAAIAALVLAVAAAIADYRQRRRHDLDRVALLDWRSVQVFALMTAIILAGVAFNL
jgi:acyl-CoA synthetase (AMP-forming)/AMP-acid ligase II